MFAHLHNHTEYSLLDGYGSVDKMIERAVQLGQPAMAITDHGNMHGAVEFYRAAKKKGIKPIIGIEAYITNFGASMTLKESGNREYNHLLLLAKSQVGYKNLLQIASIGYLDGFYYKPRIDHSVLEKYNEGIIATSGCMAAEIPNAILNGLDQAYIDSLVEYYLNIFGDNFYIELQHHPGIPEIVGMNHGLIKIAKNYNIDMIATNDAHYPAQSDYDVHDTLLCIQTRSYKSQAQRMRFTDSSYYIKSRDELEKDFAQYNLPASIFDKTLEIADMCDANPEEAAGTHHMPSITVQAPSYLHKLIALTEAGLTEKYGSDWNNKKDVKERAFHELSVIRDTGFSQYYLIVKDILDYAKEHDIIWNIRGSGTGSIICYALGLSFIDPLDKRLLFERFLNSARVTIPDLDLDFPDDRRNEIIEYIVQKYGEDNVSQIVTFGHMKARQCIRDVGRVLGYDLEFVDKIAKAIPHIPGKPITIEDSLNMDGDYPSQELLDFYNNDSNAKKIISAGIRLENTIRQVGLHAAAVIISDKNLLEYTALMRPTSSTCVTKHITQFDYPTLESLGLLKVDCLGSATLSILYKACEIIQERHGITLDPMNIPYEGPEVESAMKLIADGNTYGIFQVESHGITNAIKKMQPTEFQHIMDILSLYRPGPIDYIDLYVARMHGDVATEYVSEYLVDHLYDTQGIMIYQEQIISILSGLAGYSAAEADLVRKGISKKDQSIIAASQKKFIEGCKKDHDIDPHIALQIWEDIEKFALYGFNRAHAASYARITMQTAYLKANYPVEFMAACLIVEGGKYDKVIGYVEECKRMGIKILPPSINESKIDFSITDNDEIRFGFRSIKYIGDGVARILDDITDIRSLADLSKVPINKNILYALIGSGALDFIDSRHKLLNNSEKILNELPQMRNVVMAGQQSMFKPAILLSDSDTVHDLAQIEKETLGVWLTHHPLDRYNPVLHKIPNVATDVSDEHVGQTVTILAAVAIFDKKQTAAGKNMAFIKLSDHSGICDAILFPRQYDGEFDDGEVILVKGQVSSTRSEVPVLYISEFRRNIVFAKEEKDKREVRHVKYKTSKASYNDIDSVVKPTENCFLTVYIYKNGQPNGVYRKKGYTISDIDAKKIGLIAHV